MQQITATMKQTIDKGLWQATAEQKAQIEKINNQMQQLTAPSIAASQVENKGTVMRKETLNATESETTFVSKMVVIAIVAIALISILFVIKKRRKEDDEN